MVKDLNKSISSIGYNYLNLPNRVVRNSNISTYTYSAMGEKLFHYNGAKTKIYCSNFVYEKNGAGDELKYILFDRGRIVMNGSASSYEYYIKDHLGNTRITLDEAGKLLQVADYYPFGMRQEPVVELSTDNKYLYNGKELQDDTEWLDYGFRMYDPALGRFHSIDLLADFKPGITPYTYADNNPVRYVDLYGLDKEDRIKRRRERRIERANNKRKRLAHKNAKPKGRGKKHKPNYHNVPPHEPGQVRWNPPRLPKFELSINDDIEIEDPEFEFEGVNLPDLKPIRIKDDPWDPKDYLTGKRTDLPTVFESDHSYVSRNQEQFNKWLKGISQQLNQRGLTIQVTVFTAYDPGATLQNSGKYYYAPGVERTGTATNLMNARAKTIDNALSGAGINNVLKTQKQYSTGGGKNHTIYIQIF